MQKTNIEWTDYSWNPIKGICPVGCWYCYARKIYKRFKLLEKYGYGQVHRNGLYFETKEAYCKFSKKPSKIFVCSTLELFHKDIPDGWRDFIFAKIERNPQHTFQILTKLPQNIDRPMPDNVWLGVSVTGEDNDKDFNRIKKLQKSKAKIKFISYEPLLNIPFMGISNIDWMIIGRLTGHGHKYDPPKDRIENMVEIAKEENIPIFLKDNLKEIWEEPLIQEFPNSGGKLDE